MNIHTSKVNTPHWTIITERNTWCLALVHKCLNNDDIWWCSAAHADIEVVFDTLWLNGQHHVWLPPVWRWWLLCDSVSPGSGRAAPARADLTHKHMQNRQRQPFSKHNARLTDGVWIHNCALQIDAQNGNRWWFACEWTPELHQQGDPLFVCMPQISLASVFFFFRSKLGWAIAQIEQQLVGKNYSAYALCVVRLILRSPSCCTPRRINGLRNC